jgi:hypothetical protein
MVMVRGGLRGVLMAGRVKARGSIRGAKLGGAGWPGTAEFGGGAAGVGRRRVGDRADSRGGVHLIERDERECDLLGRCEPKRKMYFCGDAIDTRARWAGEEGFSLRGKVGQRGWLGQRPSGLVRLAGLKAGNE